MLDLKISPITRFLSNLKISLISIGPSSPTSNLALKKLSIHLVTILQLALQLHHKYCLFILRERLNLQVATSFVSPVLSLLDKFSDRGLKFDSSQVYSGTALQKDKKASSEGRLGLQELRDSYHPEKGYRKGAQPIVLSFIVKYDKFIFHVLKLVRKANSISQWGSFCTN